MRGPVYRPLQRQAGKSPPPRPHKLTTSHTVERQQNVEVCKVGTLRPQPRSWTQWPSHAAELGGPERPAGGSPHRGLRQEEARGLSGLPVGRQRGGRVIPRAGRPPSLASSPRACSPSVREVPVGSSQSEKGRLSVICFSQVGCVTGSGRVWAGTRHLSFLPPSVSGCDLTPPTSHPRAPSQEALTAR